MYSILLASSLMFHYINVPVANMREHPENLSEIVSQAYFSEQVNVIEESSDWVKIETIVDHYEGWLKNDQLCHRVDDFYESDAIAHTTRCMTHLYQVPDVIYGPIMTLPFDSALKVIDFGERWVEVSLADGREAFVQRGDLVLEQRIIDREHLALLSFQFLGLPYTWGGRSSFGYDCSGFIQMLYRQMGIYLPRDSKDQVKWEGFKEIKISELSPGDLIYFGLSDEAIRHVGMHIGRDLFIHATVAENEPYIRISNLSDMEWNGSGKWGYRTARTLKR